NGAENPQKKRNAPSHLNYADHRGRRCPILRIYFVRRLRSCWLLWQEPLLLGRSTTQLSPINVVTTPLQCSFLSRRPAGVTPLRNTGSASCTSTARVYRKTTAKHLGGSVRPPTRAMPSLSSTSV